MAGNDPHTTTLCCGPRAPRPPGDGRCQWRLLTVAVPVAVTCLTCGRDGQNEQLVPNPPAHAVGSGARPTAVRDASFTVREGWAAAASSASTGGQVGRCCGLCCLALDRPDSGTGAFPRPRGACREGVGAAMVAARGQGRVPGPARLASIHEAPHRAGAHRRTGWKALPSPEDHRARPSRRCWRGRHGNRMRHAVIRTSLRRQAAADRRSPRALAPRPSVMVG